MQSPNHASKGFTLIELITVILLLGLVAVLSLPRFSEINDQAEIAQAKGIAGSFKVGVQTVKAVFNAQDLKTRVQNLQGYGNNDIDTNNQGYPIGTDKGNGNENIGRGNIGCALLWRGLIDSAPSVSHNNNNQDYRSYRHTGNRVCSYVYRGNGDLGNQNTGRIIIRYDSRDGSVRVCGTQSQLPAC